MSKESPQVYHIVAFEFEGRDRARQVADLIKKGKRTQE
jgi:hypothetical protein